MVQLYSIYNSLIEESAANITQQTTAGIRARDGQSWFDKRSISQVVITLGLTGAHYFWTDRLTLPQPPPQWSLVVFYVEEIKREIKISFASIFLMKLMKGGFPPKTHQEPICNYKLPHKSVTILLKSFLWSCQKCSQCSSLSHETMTSGNCPSLVFYDVILSVKGHCSSTVTRQDVQYGILDVDYWHCHIYGLIIKIQVGIVWVGSLDWVIVTLVT